MCKCTDPKTGEIKEVPAKTKEMVYRIQAPWIVEIINKEIHVVGTSKPSMGMSGKGEQ